MWRYMALPLFITMLGAASPAPSMSAVGIVAVTVCGEAASEPELGKVAIAWTIVNRVAKNPKLYGSDVIRASLKRNQYTYWTARPIINNTDLSECERVAEAVLSGRIPDPTHGATHYHKATMKTLPKWAVGHQPCFIVGAHYFYNDIL